MPQRAKRRSAVYVESSSLSEKKTKSPMFFLYDKKGRELLAPSIGWPPIHEQIDNTICASGFSLKIVPRRSEVPSNMQGIITEKYTRLMDANHWSTTMSNQADNFYFDRTGYSGRAQLENNQFLFEKALAADQTAAYKLFASLYARLRLGKSSITSNTTSCRPARIMSSIIFKQ